MVLFILFALCSTLCHSYDQTIESKPETGVQQDHKYPALICNLLFTLCSTLRHSHDHTIESKAETGVQHDHKYPALICNLDENTDDNSRLLACPASTREEKQFNDEVSITGLSLFVQNINSSDAENTDSSDAENITSSDAENINSSDAENTNGSGEENIVSGICDKPLQPAMIYNTITKKYEIGYELYAQGKAKLRNRRYSHYRPVNPNNEIINSTKSPSQIAVEYQDGNKTKFFIADQSTTLIFHWIPELFFTYSGYDKQIRLKNENVEVPNEELRSKCEDYINLAKIDMKIYLSPQQNPKEILKSAFPDIGNLKEWNASQSYGVLGLSQIIPLWYFPTYSARLASCSHMNMVPVWKTIAGQLRKVDLYLQALFRTFIREKDIHLFWFEKRLIFGTKRIIFGVSDILTVHPEPSQNLNSTSALFSSPDPHHRQLIPVPKIIYRIVEGGYYDSVYSAVIVIHNDPNNVSNSDRICSPEEEIGGWETIKNNDVRTGLTYVCRYQVKEVVHDKIAIHADNTYGGPHPLALNDIRSIYSNGRNGGVMAHSHDLKWKVDNEFGLRWGRDSIMKAISRT